MADYFCILKLKRKASITHICDPLQLPMAIEMRYRVVIATSNPSFPPTQKRPFLP